MEVQLKHPDNLSEQELSLWRSLTHQPQFSSPFFHPAYTQSIAKYRRQVEVAVFTADSHAIGFFPFERHDGKVGRPLGIKLADFQGCVSHEPIQFDQPGLLKRLNLSQIHFDHLVHAEIPTESIHSQSDSPYMDLSHGYQEYLTARRESGNRSLSQVLRKERKLEREVGPITFQWQDMDEQAMHSLFEWKSAQRQATNTADILEFEWVKNFLKHLHQTKHSGMNGALSTLRIHDRVVAVHFGIFTEKCLHYWFPTYDYEFHKYSPGLILLLRMAEQCAELGISRLDLGKGNDSYKDSLASGAVSVAEACYDRSSTRRFIRRSLLHAIQWVKQSRFKSALQKPKKLIRQWQNKSAMGAS